MSKCFFFLPDAKQKTYILERKKKYTDLILWSQMPIFFFKIQVWSLSASSKASLFILFKLKHTKSDHCTFNYKCYTLAIDINLPKLKPSLEELPQSKSIWL